MDEQLGDLLQIAGQTIIPERLGYLIRQLEIERGVVVLLKQKALRALRLRAPEKKLLKAWIQIELIRRVKCTKPQELLSSMSRDGAS